jgi:hypothetical protein
LKNINEKEKEISLGFENEPFNSCIDHKVIPEKI